MFACGFAADGYTNDNSGQREFRIKYCSMWDWNQQMEINYHSHGTSYSWYMCPSGQYINGFEVAFDSIESYHDDSGIAGTAARCEYPNGQEQTITSTLYSPRHEHGNWVGWGYSKT